MRSTSVAFAVVLVGASSAHAEEPIVVRAGLGLTADRGPGLGESVTRFGPGIQSDIGYRFRKQLAVGVHFGLARSWQKDLYESGNIPGSGGWRWHEVYTSFQLGLGAQWSSQRFWFAPWIGVDDRATRSISTDESPALSWNPEGTTRRGLAFGLGGGIDLYVDSTRHRVSAYLDVARTQRSRDVYIGNSEETVWISRLYLSVGIAYRYW